VNWLIKGAHVVSPADDLNRKLDLLVINGRIAEIGTEIDHPDARLVEAGGLLLLPGLIDLHTHLCEPGAEERENIESGSLAAARGGYTTILMMPDTDPPLDTAPAVAQALNYGAKKGHVRILVSGALSIGLRGEAMPEFAALAEAGAQAFVQPDGSIGDAALFRRMLQYVKGMVPLIGVQPHDASLVVDGLMHEGVASTLYGLRGIPTVAEETALVRDLLLAADTNCPVHFYRISTADSVRFVARAKAAGIPVSCDVSPYHLVLTDEALANFDTTCKLQPPLRSADHVDVLVSGLAEGIIDCVSTDHTPWTDEEKDVEFAQAPWGATALETTLPLLYTKLVSVGRLSLTRLVEALSTRPAELLGLRDGAGTLRLGSPADFTLVDPETERVVSASDLISKSKNTPLLGQRLHGWPVATFVGGRLVWEDVR